MATVTENNVLEAQPRTPGNKNEARRVRRGGKLPGVLYGAGKEALSLTLDPRQVTRILHSGTGHNTIFDLALNGERTKATCAMRGSVTSLTYCPRPSVRRVRFPPSGSAAKMS